MYGLAQDSRIQECEQQHTQSSSLPLKYLLFPVSRPLSQHPLEYLEVLHREPERYISIQNWISAYFQIFHLGKYFKRLEKDGYEPVLLKLKQSVLDRHTQTHHLLAREILRAKFFWSPQKELQELCRNSTGTPLHILAETMSGLMLWTVKCKAPEASLIYWHKQELIRLYLV